VLPADVDHKGRTLLWTGLSASALFSAVSYPIMFVAGLLIQPAAFFNQQRSWVIGLWTFLCGLFTLLVITRNYRKYAKAHGLNLREQGVFLDKERMWKSILLAVLSAVCTYSIVFVTQFFFTTDFRFWFIFIFRPFTADKFDEILKMLPFFVFFFVINSIAMNVFNFVKINRKEWVNTLIMAIFNALGPLLVLIVFYSIFLTTGLLPTDKLGFGVGSLVFWIMPMIIILPVATVLSRIIYKATRNPYLPGIAFSIIITTMLCTNAVTTLI
jgi:hypothetical protein